MHDDLQNWLDMTITLYQITMLTLPYLRIHNNFSYNSYTYIVVTQYFVALVFYTITQSNWFTTIFEFTDTEFSYNNEFSDKCIVSFLIISKQIFRVDKTAFLPIFRFAIEFTLFRNCRIYCSKRSAPIFNSIKSICFHLSHDTSNK